MRGTAQIIAADWTATPEGIVPSVQVEVGEDGRIRRVGRAERPADRPLPGRLLLPGFVNVHSHAFQRGLRGAGETVRPSASSTFWTWRESMYGLVERLDADGFHAASLAAFSEMRRAGITTVGEFHYLHHGEGAEDFALDEALLAAARAAGVRLVLLETYYRTGGIGRPLEGAQQRFRVAGLATFLRQLDALGGRLDGERQRLGIAAHSIRAAEPPEIGALYRAARERRLPFHIHLEEQRQEIADCVAAYGAPPAAVLLLELGGAEGLTAVHCTHTAPADLGALLEAGANICLCPLTEANLADGLPELPARSAAAYCLGTDSNARISMLEEARWLEYGQRLRNAKRGALAAADGSLAAALLRCATESGARALGLEAGRIAPGCWADFATVDLGHPSLAGWTPETLLAALLLGCGDEVILETCVGGLWQAHRHPHPAT